MTYRYAASCGKDERVAQCVRRSARPFDLDDVFETAQLSRAEPSVITPCFVPAYHRLTASLTEEAGLTPTGVDVARRRLVHALANQINVRELVESHGIDPELHGDDAVFILGLPGTGLYRLQRLLNQHAELNIPSLWEILSPTMDWRPWHPKRSPDDPFEHTLWAHLAQRDGVPPPDFGAPYGDHLLLTYAFHSPSASLEYRIPAYADWLQAQDANAAYEFHRSALALILDRVRGGTPLLVNEFHAFHLPALLAAYPTARVIRVHRDPLVSLTNVAGISSMRRRVWSHQMEPHEVTAEWAHHLSTAMAMPGWCDVAAIGAAVLDISYADVVETPLLTVRRICEFLRIPLPRGVERRILEQCEQLPRDTGTGRLVHTDDAALPDVFRDRRAMYCSRWGVPAA